VQGIFGMPSKRNRILGDRQTVGRQYTILTLCTFNPQVYRGWKGTSTSSHPKGKTTPSTSWMKVQNNDQWPQKKANKHGVMYSTKKQTSCVPLCVDPDKI